MSSETKLRLGTRQSPLAIAQAEETRRRLCEAHGWAEDAVELVKVRASGDKIQDRPLADIGGKALWTRELDIWLAEGRIDAAVHSMKDVETLRPESLTIAAILPRADVRDVLIGASSIQSIPRGAVVGTSAPRRAAQLLHHRPDCEVVTFRGNVATRLAKLAAGEAQATFLAAAGLERLGRTGTGTVLPADEFLPAPAQGAIGIECNTDDAQTRDLLSAISHQESRDTVMAERALLEALGGTCHSPIAVLSEIKSGMLTMKASLFSAEGNERVDGEIKCDPHDQDAARTLGRDLLSRAASAITVLFNGQS
ncbi:hydroxymethylbilane synthase [Pontixanthobacter luteolus]|uniref:hydroxymethylbilane synthase n=1 Tax=Pontixanthobacter luteolus TaxID=295089 RepID=UPI0023023912|nr:hydroxymethylbilane synthase [Pontixanthobacter luteolus]